MSLEGKQTLRLGKIRVFDCQCGGKCVRPLKGRVKDCDCCGASLEFRPHVVDDLMRTIREELDRSK